MGENGAPPGRARQVAGIVTAFVLAALVLLVAPLCSRGRPNLPRNRWLLSEIDAAMDQYHLHFGAYPPDETDAFCVAKGLTGTEVLSYFLCTPFRLKQTIAYEPDLDRQALMVRADRDAGPFLALGSREISDRDGDAVPEICDTWGRPLRYRRVPAVLAPGGKAVASDTYHLRSTGANGLDENGEGDDIGTGPATPVPSADGVPTSG